MIHHFTRIVTSDVCLTSENDIKLLSPVSCRWQVAKFWRSMRIILKKSSRKSKTSRILISGMILTLVLQ